MATLISKYNDGTEDFLTAGSWGLVFEGGTGSAHLDSEAGNTEVALSPSWGASATFTPGAITVDGIAVKVNGRAASPSGTLSVCIGQAGTPVAGTTVTINVTDIPYAVTAGHYGWMFFKFSAPVTLAGATAYSVMAQESVAADDVSLFRDATASNWSRCLRTTTTQAPAAGDKMIIAGEWTAAGTFSAITVNMNNADATDYGTGSTTLPSLAVCSKGTLDWTYNATRQLRLSGILAIYAGGTMNIGTVANPVGSAYTHTLELDCAANGDFGLIKYSGGTLVVKGATRTYDRCMLAADAIATATSITTDVSTGWKNGETIIIAPTDRTAAHYDVCTLSGDASGTTINLVSGLSWAHTGTSPVQAEIIVLNRNILITSVNSSYKGYVQIAGGVSSIGSTDIDWARFQYFGSNTSAKDGINIGQNNFTETFSIDRCCITDGYYGLRTPGSGFDYDYTISNCTFYNLLGSYSCGSNSGINAGITFTNNWSIYTTSTAFVFGSACGTITDNRAIGVTGTGFSFTGLGPFGTCSDNIAHSCATGLQIASVKCRGGTITNFKAWNNSSYGLTISTIVQNVTFSNLVCFGNASGNIEVTNTLIDCVFSGGSLNGYTSYTSAYGLYFGRDSSSINTLFSGMAIGVASGNYLDHTTGEIYLAVAYTNVDVAFYNCTWGAATKVSIFAGNVQNYSLRFSKDAGTEGNDWSQLLNGILTHNATEGISSSDCLELQPTGNASYLDLSNYLDFGMFQAPAVDGVSRTVYIQLKDNVAWDGTNVSISLWQNGTKVVDWADKSGTITTTYTEYSLTYTPTEDGVLDLAIKLDGDAGRVYADGFRWT